jgi:hypothetical protein
MQIMHNKDTDLEQFPPVGLDPSNSGHLDGNLFTPDSPLPNTPETSDRCRVTFRPVHTGEKKTSGI